MVDETLLNIVSWSVEVGDINMEIKKAVLVSITRTEVWRFDFWACARTKRAVM